MIVCGFYVLGLFTWFVVCDWVIFLRELVLRRTYSLGFCSEAFLSGVLKMKLGLRIKNRDTFDIGWSQLLLT